MMNGQYLYSSGLDVASVVSLPHGLLVAYLLQVAMKMTHGQEMTWHGVETSIQKKIKDTDLIVNTTPPGVSSNAGLDSRSLHPLAGRRSYLSSLGPFSSRKLDYRKISRSCLFNYCNRRRLWLYCIPILNNN